MGFNWTAEAVDQLRAIAAKGLSASQIGAEIGVSRNAIIGKALRVGIELQYKPKPARPKPPRQPRMISKKRLAPVIVPMAPEPDARNRTLLELKRRDCRYPVTADSPFLFCGHPKAEGSSYCANHHHVSTRGRE